jgi:hypothetical protein
MLFITRNILPQNDLSYEQFFKEAIDIFMDGIAVRQASE